MWWYIASNPKHMKVYGCNVTKCDKVKVVWILLQSTLYNEFASFLLCKKHITVIQMALPGWLCWECLRFWLCCILQCPLETVLRLRDVSVAPMRLVRHAVASGQPSPASHNSPHTPGTVHRQPSPSWSLSVSHPLITRLLVPQSIPLECEHQD